MVGEFSSVRCSIALTCAAHQGTTNEVKCGYVLVAFVTQMKRLEIGRLGAYDIVPAYYAYVGSAFGAGGLPRMAFSMPVGDIVNFAVQQLHLGDTWNKGTTKMSGIGGASSFPAALDWILRFAADVRSNYPSPARRPSGRETASDPRHEKE
jgi:hypothetical protein